MATADQLARLRRFLQDYYHKSSGALLTIAEQAFTDTELTDLLEESWLEVSGGVRTPDTGTAADEPYAFMLARADGILMIAQDEARRIKWQTNNEVIDPSQVGETLLRIAAELRYRYEQSRKRKHDIDLIPSVTKATGGITVFNDSVSPHYERNFDNASTRRNRTNDHRY